VCVPIHRQPDRAVPRQPLSRLGVLDPVQQGPGGRGPQADSEVRHRRVKTGAGQAEEGRLAEPALSAARVNVGTHRHPRPAHLLRGCGFREFWPSAFRCHQDASFFDHRPRGCPYSATSRAVRRRRVAGIG